MSHFNFTTPSAYEPDPSSNSHPHQPSQHTLTEAFWHQYPAWATPEQLQNTSLQAINNYHRYAMDHHEENLVIGYNTKNGKRLPPGPKGGQAKLSDKDKPRAKGKVDVYIQGVFLQKVLFSQLLRFSTTAQKAFPRPPKKVEKKEEEGEPAKREWADAEAEDIDVSKLSADIAKLIHGTQSEPSATASNKDNKNKRLDVELATIWTQPPPDAFKFAFNWMHEAARVPQDQELLYFGVPNPDNLSLEKLVDIYAAALCLGLRPRPVKHLTDIFERLTKTPPSLDDIVYIHEHLPVSDSAMTRAINSFLTNRSATSEVYTKAEREAIEKYFNEVDEELYNRVNDIFNYREEQRKTRLRDQGALRLQKLAEGVEPLVDGEGVDEANGNGDGGKSMSAAAEGGRGGGQRQQRARGGSRKQQAGRKEVSGNRRAAS